MRTLVTLSALALLAITGPATAGKDRKAVPNATPIGKPISCVQLTQVRSTKVHGDKIIDFHMTGGKVYRNELPMACSPLGFEDRFSYKSSMNQLCSSDIITVIQTPPSIPGPSCGLGKFQPVELEKH